MLEHAVWPELTALKLAGLDIDMKVFISSLITGMEPFRAAAREAVSTLRGEPIMAEDFGARPHSPQVSCLSELRRADVVALILGERYGALQPSGLSATHEEYRDAQGRKPVLAFVQEGVTREPAEAEFVREVQSWEAGLFRGGFTTPDDLKTALTRALHDYQLANAVGPVDTGEMVQRAATLLPADRQNSAGNAMLNLAVAGAPRQTILRPIEIENPALADHLHQTALFGVHRLFDHTVGVEREIEDGRLVVRQANGRAEIALDEQGSILVRLPVRRNNRMMPELVEEFVHEQMAGALAYAAGVLDHVDPTQRLTHVAVAVQISDADFMAWRTLRESEANPNSMSLGSSSNNRRAPVSVNRPRAALRLDAVRLVEDLLGPLRRQWR